MLDLHRLRLLREVHGRGTVHAAARALGYNPAGEANRAAAQDWWRSLGEGARSEVLSLPNFDAAKFLACDNGDHYTDELFTSDITAKNAKDGAVILAMLPDTGERYFSTPLFEGVNEGSDDEWLASLG